MKKLFYILIPCLFIQNVSFSQSCIFKGIITDASTAEAVTYCSVYFAELKKGSISDGNGYFSIGKIPKGSYKLKIFCVGYDSIVEEITFLKEGSIIQKNFKINPISYRLETATVTAERVANRTEVRASAQHVLPKQIIQIPNLGGIPDLAQYLQVLPGIISTGDQGGQLYVRGGTPIQNKVMLDGMTIYNPFHSIGLFSIFDTDILRDVDIFTAGFNAEYGGRTSSIMNIKTRNGNKKFFSGKLDLSTFGTKLLLEGPLKKKSKDNSTAISFITSVKSSYIKQSSKLLYKYASENGLPYNYFDAYGKISMEFSKANHINIFGFNFSDNVDYPKIAKYSWNSYGLGTNFMFLPSMSNMLVNGTMAYSKYCMKLDEYTDFGRYSGISDFTFSTDFTYILGKNLFKYGFNLTGTWVNYDFTNAFGVDCGQKSFNSELALYAKYKWVLDKWIIEPGLRIDNYASQNAISPEPRIALKYLINDFMRLKLAAGLYSQNLISATSDRDVVNLFYGFLSVPNAETLSGQKIRNSLQKGQHAVCGIEVDVKKHTLVNIEAYFKNFSLLTNMNRYQMFEDDDEFMLEKGKSYGGDISVKYNNKNIYIWIAYSLTWVKRNDGKIVYRTHFDRRHNINITTSFTWGKYNCWRFDARWNYGSGFPFTLTSAIYPNIVNISDLQYDIIGTNETLGIMLDDLNRGQLPDYHRLDINVNRTLLLSEKIRMNIGGGITNLYNYSNIFYVSRKTNEKIYQLPFLWSILINFKW